MHHPAARLALVLIVSSLAGAAGARADDGRRAKLQQFAEMSEQQLSDRLSRLLAKDDFRRDVEYEACLSEMARRGGKGAVPLQKHLDALTARTFPPDTEPGSLYNLELLTALRRAQRQPDPLTILVERGDGPLTATPLALPRLKVSIKNVDVGRKEVGFTFGGNYRSGRQARWRLAVVDDQGKTVPTKQTHGLLTLGGLYQEGMLEFGESWETVIEMQDFIESPPPGRYQLQVLYHNTQSILFAEDLRGMIVCRSDPIPLLVSPTVIEVTDEQKRSAQEWIAALQPATRIKVVAGTYGEWAHEFVPPESPPGKLLSMGLAAAPPLVDALRDESLAAEKRAWILSLLYSVTGLHDPRQGSILASYEYVKGPWQVWGGIPGEPPSGGVGLASKVTSFGGKIDTGDQQRLAKKWFAWLETVELRTAEPQEAE